MNKRQTGFGYERKAAVYLESQGYQILARNYRCPNGEIDLVAREGGDLVFVEVKYRKDAGLGSPFEAVHRGKQQRIYRTALWYLAREQVPEGQNCRFDVVGITGDKIELMRNAFEV